MLQATGSTDLPSYDALPRLPGIDLPHAWDVLDRQLGSVGHLSPEHVRNAAALVRSGETFALNLPVHEPDPPLFGREPLSHTIVATDRNTLDERLDCFHPQGSSQWDGLRHVRAREHGYFGGVTDGLEPGRGPLGIEAWARRGIVGRGVLLDVAGHRGEVGITGPSIAAAELAEVAAAQSVELRPADIVCVRTGWLTAYRALDAEGRRSLAAVPLSIGLHPDEEMARWLWDARVAALACDNPAVEPVPGDPAVGSLHRRVLPTLGLALAELIDLDLLAASCRGDHRWDFLFVAVPLHLVGGVGSPANAVAIR